VLEQVGEYAVVRQVDGCGKIWLYDQGHWVGKGWVGQKVYVRLDAERREWVIEDRKGREIGRQEARQLTAKRIRTLKVGREGSHS
jgi:hypothetical protein